MSNSQPVVPAAAVAAKPFDLFSLPGILVLMALFFAFGLYFLIDTFFIDLYKPVNAMPWLGFVLPAIAGAGGGVTLVRGAPLRESAILALMLAGIVTAAAYPAILRVNAMTAGAAPLVANYLWVAAGEYAPQDKTLPPIRFNRRYTLLLSDSVAGSEREFMLLHGGLGFYQLDLSELRDTMMMEQTANTVQDIIRH